MAVGFEGVGKGGAGGGVVFGNEDEGHEGEGSGWLSGDSGWWYVETVGGRRGKSKVIRGGMAFYFARVSAKERMRTCRFFTP